MNIYWADTGQPRNGLAIVTRRTATDVVQLAVHGHHNDDSRPIMGVQIGNNWYFNAHAHPGGRDALTVFETVRQEMNRRNVDGSNWRIVGDFNQGPQQFPPQLQGNIIAPGQPTHEGGGEYDYAIDGAPANTSVRAVTQALNSDHLMVVIHNNGICRRDVTAACETEPSGTPRPGHTYRVFADGASRKVIADQDREGARLLGFHRGVGQDDRGYMVQVRFSDDPGKYLLAVGGDNDDASCIERYGDRTRGTICDPGSRQQQWKLDGNRIEGADLGNFLQPAENGALAVHDDDRYHWTFKPLDYMPPREELRKREDSDDAAEEQDHPADVVEEREEQDQHRVMYRDVAKQMADLLDPNVRPGM